MNETEKFFLVAFILAMVASLTSAIDLGPFSASAMAWFLIAIATALLFIIWPEED